MQTIVALSSTEAEYVSLLQSMQKAIPIFWSFVVNSSIKVLPISKKEQVADLLTKILPHNQFLML